MADTIRGDFSKTACSDCGKFNVALFRHWGPLVPPGEIGTFCEDDFQARSEERNRGFAPRSLGTKPRPAEELSAEEK